MTKRISNVEQVVRAVKAQGFKISSRLYGNAIVVYKDGLWAVLRVFGAKNGFVIEPMVDRRTALVAVEQYGADLGVSYARANVLKGVACYPIGAFF